MLLLLLAMCLVTTLNLYLAVFPSTSYFQSSGLILIVTIHMHSVPSKLTILHVHTRWIYVGYHHLSTLLIQVNKKFRKFERKYRDCIKRKGDKIGTVMLYQRNIMGTSIYHNMSVSQSCLLSFLCNPYISFQIS